MTEEERRHDREKLVAFAGGVSRYANQNEGHIVDFPDPPMMSTSWGKEEVEAFMQMLEDWACMQMLEDWAIVKASITQGKPKNEYRSSN